MFPQLMVKLDHDRIVSAFSTLFFDRTCSKLFNSWCFNNTVVYCCTTTGRSCNITCRILEQYHLWQCADFTLFIFDCLSLFMLSSNIQVRLKEKKLINYNRFHFSEIPEYDIFYIVLIEQPSIFLSVQVIHHGKDDIFTLCKISFVFIRLLLRPAQSLSSTTTIAIVWIMAFLGITYQILYHERYKLLETCIYITVGVFPAIVILDMVRKEIDKNGILFQVDLF